MADFIACLMLYDGLRRSTIGQASLIITEFKILSLHNFSDSNTALDHRKISKECKIVQNQSRLRYFI